MIYSSPSTSLHPILHFRFLLPFEHNDDNNNCYLLCAEMELKCVVSNKKYALCSATFIDARNAIFKLEKYLFELHFPTVLTCRANISSSIQMT